MARLGGHIWLFSKKIDLVWLFLPVWITWLVCFALPESILNQSIPLWFWVVFILGIDVTHVWSTIFRTYLDKEEFKQHRDMLIAIPFACFTGLMVIATVSEYFFWRVMAYIALHHFIKQQYGFLALYRARFGRAVQHRFVSDKLAIYTGMLWPVLFWHLNQGRQFSWFVQGDFLEFGTWLSAIGIPSESLWWFNAIGNVVYAFVLLVWLVEEIGFAYQKKQYFAWGKVLWVVSTALNWFLGIVWFNSDFAFSLTNVVAHGIPYMVLIFFYVERKKQLKKPRNVGVRFLPVLQMLLIICFLAFGEEYFWDMLLNREKEALFRSMFAYPIAVLQSPIARGVALGLLSVPQVAHYFIDGIIWKKSPKNPYVPQVLGIGKPASSTAKAASVSP